MVTWLWRFGKCMGGKRERSNAIPKSAAELMYDSLGVSERLPRDELEAYVQRQLRAIVGHARDTVPFYQGRLSAVLAADGTLDSRAWEDLPVITRHDLAEHFEALKSTAVPAAHGEVKAFSTSGTSGIPVTVLKTALTSRMELAMMARFYRRVGIDPTCRLVMIRAAAHPKLRYMVQEQEPWVPDWMVPANGFGTYSRLAYPMGLSEQLEYIRHQGPVYLNTQPSNAAGLIAMAEQESVSGFDIRGIITLGEYVTAQMRRDAERVFGCLILDTYSANDVCTIASQCACGALHVNAECVRVDILRPDGSACGEGEEGRIVLTTLVNAAMPLVRYDIGDIGYIGGTCPYGLTLPRLVLTVGRQRRLFRFSDGTEIAPIFGMEKFATSFPVVQWQLAQVGPEALELRFSSRAGDDALDFEGVTQAVRAYFQRPVSVAFRRYAQMQVGPGGKIDQFVKEEQAGA